MDSNENTENIPDQGVYQEIIVGDSSNYLSEMHIIDNNIARCVMELQESFENLTDKMVKVQNVAKVDLKYEH